jgi:hypothetical protein
MPREAGAKVMKNTFKIQHCPPLLTKRLKNII